MAGIMLTPVARIQTGAPTDMISRTTSAIGASSASAFEGGASAPSSDVVRSIDASRRRCMSHPVAEAVPDSDS
jgi:hypothetical protein